MPPLGRTLILIGIIALAAGILLTYSDLFSQLRIGRLPGDIHIKRQNFQFFFPITTCVLISLILSVILYMIRK